MPNKKGLSAVITSLIIILLILVFVAILYTIFMNFISTKTEGISLGEFTINLKIESIKVDGNSINIKIRRNPGKGNLSGIKFIIDDGIETRAFEEPTNIKELGLESFTLNYDGLVKGISIAPIIKLESGKEKSTSIADKFEFSNKQIIKNLGPVSWWRFEGDARDEVGKNHGMEYGGVSYINGKYGKACEFNGSSYIDVPDDDSLDITDTITIEAWIYRTSNTPVDQRIVQKGDTNNQYALMFEELPTSENLKARLNINGVDKLFTFDKTVGLNTWHHVVLTYNGSQARGYVDGIGSTPISATGSIGISEDNFQIGRRGDGITPSTYFKGAIDELRIYNKILTEKQIKALYNLK